MSERSPAWLSDLVLRMAASEGDPEPSRIEYVKTTYRTLAEARGARGNPAGGEVYDVVLHGHFTHRRHPYGVPPPPGSVLTLTIDAASQRVGSLQLGDQTPDLSALGQAHSVPPDRGSE